MVVRGVRQPIDVHPDTRYGFEPALDTFALHQPGDGSPARWQGAYSQNALTQSLHAPRHAHMGKRNPELHAQMDAMVDQLDRVQNQAISLQKATGRMGESNSRPLRTELEEEVKTMSAKIDSLSLTVGALVQSLIGLGASAFNWSEGLGTPRRKGLAELVLAYTRPMAHVDPGLQDLCTDLGVELAKDKLDDVPAKPWDGQAWDARGRSVSPGAPHGRSPPPGAPPGFGSPQKSKFQMKGAVAASMSAWKDGEKPVSTQFKGANPAEISRLKITILNAKGLRKADLVGGSDPYCIVQVPGKKNTSFQTPTIQNTQTPTWDHSFFCEHVKGDSLKFTVYDADTGRVDSMLGVVVMEENFFYPSGYHGELKLEKGGKGSKDPTLKVKMEVIEHRTSSEPELELSPLKPTR